MFRRSDEEKSARAQRQVEYREKMEGKAELRDELKAYMKQHRSSLVASFGDINAYSDRIIRVPGFTSPGSLFGGPDGPEVFPIAGVEAVIDTAGGISARSTLARTAVPGAHGWQKKVDTRETWLLVTGPQFQWVVKVQPALSSFARSFAAKITGAGAAARFAQGPTQEAAPSGPGTSATDELRKLAELRDAGVVTEEEFARTKARLLDSM